MSRLEVWVAENNDVEMKCTSCGMQLTIPIAWAESMFWDIHVGQHLLRLLQHSKDCVVAEHDCAKIICADPNRSELK